MKKINKFNIIYVLILVYALICLIFDIRLNLISAIIATLLIILSLMKSRKNVLLFFSFLIIGYFVYSVVLCRYIFPGGPLYGVFYQLEFNSTNSIGLNCILIFYCILMFLTNNLKPIQLEKNFFKCAKENKKTYVVSIIIIFLVAFAFLNNAVLRVFSNSSQIYEYCLILFIFGFYYVGNNKKLRIILTLILLLFSGYTLLEGGRVPILQMLIIYFLMNMIYKFNCKEIILFTIAGIILFTVFGIYGDSLLWGTEFSLKYVITQMIERRFALDTSLSSYFTGLTFIDYTNFVTVGERISNFWGYIKYTFLGNMTKYQFLTDITIKKYVHYHGGYITSYFYYWLGIPGVILISLYVGKLFNMIKNIKYDNDTFKKLFSIYIISTIPRWFLYFPTPLFRGVIIFMIVYLIINIYINGDIYEKN